MKEEIIKICNENDLIKVGFCNTKNILVDYSRYELQDKLGYRCSFQVGKIEDKDLSSEKYSIYNTVIAVLLPYKKVNFEDKDKVYFSAVASGEDYHKTLTKKLQKVGDYLKKNNYIYKIFVDNNPLDEKNLAYNCGLGFFGKNNLLINSELGSYFNIGIILTDAIIESDKILKCSCGECNLCVKSCPSKAINEDGILNANKCLSYLTQKKNLDNIDTSNFNNCIYGCDICMSVCPYNKKVEYVNENGINPDDFLNMNEEEFNEKYKDTAVAWRGNETLDRNISIYLKNIDK